MVASGRKDVRRRKTDLLALPLPVSAKVQVNLITAGKVRVSLPPLSVSLTQPASVEWQIIEAKTKSNH